MMPTAFANRGGGGDEIKGGGAIIPLEASLICFKARLLRMGKSRFSFFAIKIIIVAL